MQLKSWPAVLLLAGVVALPATASAQATDTTQAPGGPKAADSAGRGPRMGGPAARLLAHRSELQLTDDQVKQLEAIRTKYDQKDTPLRDQLHQAIGAMGDSTHPRPDFQSMSPDERRQAMRQMRREHRQYLSQHPEVANALKQLRADRDSARKEALAVLTPSQRDQVKQRAAEWRARADSAGGGRHRGGWHAPAGD
jgi:Spy/CpxP family protein refolding chaperone